MFAATDWTALHLYVVFMCGILVIVVNCAIVVVVFMNTSLRSQYLLIIVIGSADIIFGLSKALTAGAHWLKLHNNSEAFDAEKTFATDCLFEWWLIVDLVGGQWPAWTKTIIGGKRLLAVFCPVFYHQHCNLKPRLLRSETRKVFCSISLTIVIIFVIVAYSTVRNAEPISQLCLPIEIFSPSIDLTNRLLIIFAHSLGFLLSSVALLIARWKCRQLTSHSGDLVKEVGRVTVILAVTGVELLTVCLPIVAITLTDYHIFPLSTSTRFATLLVFTTSSLVNGPIYFVLNAEFRFRIIQLFCCVACRSSEKRRRTYSSIRACATLHGTTKRNGAEADAGRISIPFKSISQENV